MNVLLVNPACLDKRVTDNDAAVMPIGLYYMAAQLLDQGIPTRLLNLAQPMVQESGPQGLGAVAPAGSSSDSSDSQYPELGVFLAALKDAPPAIIGFSVTNPSRFSAMRCAEAAKAAFPDVKIVFGGPAPTFMADHLFSACPALDVVVKGEGERSFPALVRALTEAGKDSGRAEAARSMDISGALSSIPGLVFRKGGGLENTGMPEPIEDLDDLVRPSRYFAYQHLAMSRGCPGNCTFCGSPKFWGTRKVRRHSAQWFFEEIQALAARGVRHFFISDDTFTQDREAVLDLCQRIRSAGLAITFNAISRVDFVDADLLVAMRQAGCIQISYGVESGSDKIRKTLGKPMEDQVCIQAFEMTRAAGIMPRAYFIYGSPGESSRTIHESISLMKRIKPLSTVFYMLVVFPGTHLYTRALQKGLVSDEVWHQKIEDLPWFQINQEMDFPLVKSFGDQLRQAFFSGLPHFVETLALKDDPALYPFHADFLSRLAMTFSHGQYARDPRITNPRGLAKGLYERALTYAKEPRAFLGLAMILQQEKEFPRAVDLLEEALHLYPGHKDLSVCMGVCLMNQGRFETALSCFTPFDKDPGLRQYIEICRSKTATP